MRHPPIDRLLDASDDPEIAAHLATCAACRAERKRFEAAEASVGEGPLDTDDRTRSVDPPVAADGSVYLSGEALAAAPGGHLEIGAVVAGHVVEAVLGRGGMALVYRVRHQVLGTPRALKVLQLSGPAIAGRVLREGRAMARLVHPNIVRVLDVITLNGAPALLMDLVDRGSLEDLLADHRVPLAEGLHLFRGIVSGVAAAHREGIVHRDLKPANVLLATGPSGQTVPQVADFGLAKATEAGERSMTRSGSTLGTLIYMAPEQVRDSSRVDARADLFSLGCVLYELVTGHRAFSACDPIEMYEQASTRAWVRPEVYTPGLPPEVVSLIEALLAPDREDRPADADAVLALLGVPEVATPAVARVALPPVPVRPALAEPRPRIRWLVAPWALLAPVFLAMSGATNQLDLALQTPVIRAIRGSLPVDDVVVVAIEGRPEDMRKLRSQHAVVIGALVEAGARAIVFDLWFGAPGEADDVLAQAIRAAAERDVQVVLATRMGPEGPNEVVPVLAAAGTVGVAEFEADVVFAVARQFQVHRRRADATPVWHLAVEGARAHHREEEPPRWDDQLLRVGALRIAAPQELVILPPSVEPEHVSYESPASFSRVKGKVAVIGTFWDEDLKRTPDGSRFGVELQAVAIQTVLSQAGLARASPAVAVACAVAAQLATAALSWTLPRRARWLVLVVPLAILAVSGALASGGTVSSAVPALVAVALVAWTLPRATGP